MQFAKQNSVIDGSELSAIDFACQFKAGIFKYLLKFGGLGFNRDSDGASVIECTSINWIKSILNNY